MKKIELAEAGAALAEYVREHSDDPVILTEGGQPVAAVISLGRVDWETISLSTNPRFQAILERSRERRRVEGGISHEELVRRLDLDEARSDATDA
ncbi:MAG: type II toxin-antitoxin system prevent-host-death family antitoxin [Dehalococcoidia bacterium]